ncbi:hypothetical protein [Aquimarina sp. Aq78]|uniref:hypothetical protein n=1 Tax=Aquimarina sp. Aq78 TaxID=1191889 RepID=UPI000D10BA97|nr:hypothetical protein [Aquimarina sp. Aq78]
MIKNIILICLIMIFCSGCNGQASEEVVLYQNTGEVDRSYDVTEATFWDFKSNGDIDSLRINNVVGFNNIYSKVLKSPYKEKPFLNPEYAIIIKTSKNIDTIYLNENLNKGYSANKVIMFKDENDLIYEYFNKNTFLTERTVYFRKNN